MIRDNHRADGLSYAGQCGHHDMFDACANRRIVLAYRTRKAGG
jgi:hypothetical protein